MNIIRIETRRQIGIETDRGSAFLPRNMVREPDNQRFCLRIARDVSADDIKAELARQLGVRAAELSTVWFHVNRDRTLSVALGRTPPEQWPEDVDWIDSPPRRRG